MAETHKAKAARERNEAAAKAAAAAPADAAPKRGPGRPPKSPPPETDKAPRKQASGAAKKANRKAADIQLIQSGFTKVLADTPALGALMLLQDRWLADHFAQQGPELATQIAAECERSEQLRSICLAAVKGQGVLILGAALAGYVVPPLLHFGVIGGAELLDIPVRKKAAAGPQGAPSHFEGGAQPPPPSDGAPPSENGGGSAAGWEQGHDPAAPGDVTMAPPIEPI